MARQFKSSFEAREMAQRLRTLAVLPDILNSIPSNHMVAQTIYNEL